MDKWSDVEMAQWLSFWASDMGTRALEKMEKLKANTLDFAMQAGSNEAIAACVNRAAGIQVVIDDIKHGIDIAERSKSAKKQ